MATLAPPSLSTVLKSNTIQSAPKATSSTPTTSSTSSPTAWYAEGTIGYYTNQGSTLKEAQELAKTAKAGGTLANEMNAYYALADQYWVDPVNASQDTSSPQWQAFQTATRWGNIYSSSANPNLYTPGKWVSANTIKPVTTPVTTPRTSTATSDTINGVKKTYVPRLNIKSFTDSLRKSRSRAEYNAGINYDELDEQAKKVADRYYERAAEQDKLLPPKDMYEERMDVETEEAKKTRETLEKQKEEMTAAEQAALAQENMFIDTQTADVTNERDTFIAEQEKLAADTETNRLNQVRGNIMQVLAARGVDISKLSPEQIVALSGEQGAKAFMDITDVREQTKANIKQARDTALARLNDLRQRKAISTSAYERNVANINSQADTAQLNADRNASAQIFALTQTKTEQGRTDATQRANAVTNIASMLGLSGSQIAPVLNLVNTKGTGPEQLVEIARMIANPESPLRKSLDANMSAAQQAALQQQLLDQYKAETARISANKTSSSSGSKTPEVITNTVATGAQ